MTWSLSSLLLPYFGSAAVTLGVVALLWPRRREPGATPLILLLLAACLWSVTNALELAAPALPEKLLWARIQYLAKVTIPVAWLVTALHYAGRGEWVTRGRLALLLVVPAVTMTLTWTAGAHDWMLHDFGLDASGPVHLVTKEYGPWFWLNLFYAYGLITFATLTILGSLLESPHLYRGQATAWLVAAAAPLAFNVAYIVGIDILHGMDLSPAAFGVSGVALYWGFRRYHLFDLLPAAREGVVEAMSEGVVVLDTHERIVDLNPAAERILGLGAESLLGRSAAETVPLLANAATPGVAGDAAISEIEMPGDGGTRTYELRRSSLRRAGSRPRGSLVIFLDVTESRRLQRELQARSVIDELTGLYNRRGFFQLAEQQRQLAVRRGSPAVMVFADVDGLKEVNDRLGHAAGDELLAGAARALRTAFRDTDVVARIGGDELAVFALDAGRHRIDTLERRLAEAIAAASRSTPGPLALSVGYALLDPGAPLPLEELLTQADHAMYQEKWRRRQAGP